MSLQPLRVKSKEAPIIREKKRTEPLLSLRETKEIIHNLMMKDERKIQNRNLKKKLIYEEKWSEGTNWSDLVREGAEREQVCLIEEERKVQEEMVDTDR